jgi:hypothetical protein
MTLWSCSALGSVKTSDQQRTVPLRCVQTGTTPAGEGGAYSNIPDIGILHPAGRSARALNDAARAAQ